MLVCPATIFLLDLDEKEHLLLCDCFYILSAWLVMFERESNISGLEGGIYIHVLRKLKTSSLIRWRRHDGIAHLPASWEQTFYKHSHYCFTLPNIDIIPALCVQLGSFLAYVKPPQNSESGSKLTENKIPHRTFNTLNTQAWRFAIGRGEPKFKI